MAKKKDGQSGGMTVAEAGRKGGLTTAERYGPQFFEEIGRKGGHKVRDLVNEAKRARGE